MVNPSADLTLRSRILRLIQAVLSWLILLWSTLIATLCLVIISTTRPAELHSKLTEPFSLFLIGLPVVLIASNLAAVKSRKLGGIVLLVAGISFTTYWVVTEDLFVNYVEVAEVSGVLFFIPACFWLVTNWRKWPSLKPSSVRWRRAVAPLWVTGIVVSTCLGSLLSTLYQGTIADFRDCKSVFVDPIDSNHAVFIGQALYVNEMRFWQHSPLLFPGFTKWALMKVERQYWGLPWWSRKYVVVFGIFGPFPTKEAYLVDGEREQGILTRFFPTIGTSMCRMTAPVNESQLELRLLQDGAPKRGVRIVGTVCRRLPGNTWDETKDVGVPGKTVVIAGPAGETTVTTDTNGNFDVEGLPAGSYMVRKEPPDREHSWQGKCREKIVKNGTVFSCRIGDNDR